MRPAGEVPQCKGLASIPGGTFLMGCHEGEGEECFGDEKPAHQVRISPFRVGRCDFTERGMEELKRAQPDKGFDDIETTCDISEPRGAWNWIKSLFGKAELRTESCDKPLVNVTWTEADAICKARGMRLWTEAEYEYLARGPSGNDVYGTADGAKPTEGNARFGHLYNGRAEVGSYAPKMWGSEAVYDLAGNVRKWVADWHWPYSADAAKDPQVLSGTDEKYRVARGGSWRTFEHYAPRGLRASYRAGGLPDYRGDDSGFRCAVATRTP